MGGGSRSEPDHFNISKDFIEYLNDKGDKNMEEYNLKKVQK